MKDLLSRTPTGPVALSLGSNAGDREALLREARALLGGPGPARIVAASPVYETEPVECRPQRWFLNQVLLVEAGVSPDMLLGFCQRVEDYLGRHRRERHGPRTMDVDILFWGGLVIRTPGLTLPHGALRRRRSLLVPLAGLGLRWVHPVLGCDVPTMLKHCRDASRVESQEDRKRGS